MEFLIYVLITIFVFLGTFIGIILSRNAFEEIKYLINYLNIFTILLISCLIFFIFYPISLLWGSIISGIILIFLILFNNKYNNKTIYACLGGVLFASSLNQNSFLIISSLIFIYGIVISTIFAYNFYNKNKINELNYEKKLKNKKLTRNLILDFFKGHFYFIVVSLVFYSIFYFII